MATRYLVEIFLPLFDRRGKRFPKRRPHVGERGVGGEFGGMTAHTRAPAVGTVESQRSVQTERDLVIIYEVMTSRLDRPWWSRYRKQLERDFRQQELVIRAHRIRVL
jgi:hypothetical protein